MTLNINSLLTGCPYEVRGLKFVRIFERRAMFSTTVNNRHFENSVPLSRRRCVGVAAPYKMRINKIVIDSAAYWDFHISFHDTNSYLPSYSIVRSPKRFTFRL